MALTFTVPTGYAGKTLVAYERLTLDNAQVAVHADLNDAAQTVTVAPAPSIRTNATDAADGDKELAYTGGKIVDEIFFEGLTPGREYVINGVLIDVATGQPTTVTGQTTFTPTAASGSTTAEFAVPTGHEGKTLVAFQRVSTIDGAAVTEHTDLHATAQTVTVGKAPTTPSGPGTPSTPGQPGGPGQPNPGPGASDHGGLPVTGANLATLSGIALLMLLAGLVLVAATRRSTHR